MEEDEFIYEEEDGDELVCVSVADDIWITKEEAEELNIPYFEG